MIFFLKTSVTQIRLLILIKSQDKRKASELFLAVEAAKHLQEPRRTKILRKMLDLNDPKVKEEYAL